MRISGIALLVVTVLALCIGVASVSDRGLLATCPGSAEDCVVDALVDARERQGIPAMLRLVTDAAESDSGFRASCTKILKSIGGRFAGDMPITRWHPDAVACNYGLIQGYARALAVRDVPLAVAMCERVDSDIGESSPNAYAECFRGIGGSMTRQFVEAAGGDPAIAAERVVQECRRRAHTDEAAYFCAAGFFNALGFDMVAERYGLSIDRVDPLFVCSRFSGELNYRCVGNMKWIAVSLVSEPGGGIQSISDSYLRAKEILSDDLHVHVVRTLAYDHGRLGLPVETVLSECGTIPLPIREQCAAGYALGIAKNGVPESYPDIVAFCTRSASEIGTSLKTCLFDALSFLRGIMPEAQYAEFCRALPSGVACYASRQ